MPNTLRPTFAFLADGFISWTGGVDFLRQCLGGIDSVVPNTTWPVLVPKATVPQRAFTLAVATKRWLWSLAGIRPGVATPVSCDKLRDAIASIGCRVEIQSYTRNSQGLERAMRNLDAQVVLPCYWSPGKSFSRKWIGYIADLQHKRLPGNFSLRERLNRDRELKTMLTEAFAIIVLSRNAMRDINEFYPGHRATLFDLPFCPTANPDFLDNMGGDMLRPYELPKKFFIVSNQFWIHKSHETAFAALRLVRDAGFDDVHILCTGDIHDYRAPSHLDMLRGGIARDRLGDRIRFLGVIPKRHQIEIVRRSVALLQPTLFEGSPGGLSVCDAVSAATPAIVSDIEVNREVDLGVIDFFRAGSAEDLSEKMVGALTNPPEHLSAETTLAILRQRQRQLGARLLQAISFVMNSAACVADDRA